MQVSQRWCTVVACCILHVADAHHVHRGSDDLPLSTAGAPDMSRIRPLSMLMRLCSAMAAGLDAVLHLDLPDHSIAIKRAVDQWLEVAHQKQADAAASTATAATAASTGTLTAQQSQLDMAAEQAKRRQQEQAASLHTQVVLQLKRHCDEWPQLCTLLPHLSTLVHEVAGGQELQQVLQAAAAAAAASLWAKAAHESKAAADAASVRAVKVRDLTVCGMHTHDAVQCACVMY